MINIQGIVDALVSHAASTGHFETVNAHEAKSAPGPGLVCAVWADALSSAPAQSGLHVTTARLTMKVRIYQPMLKEPADAIDPDMLRATDTLMAAYTEHFTLGGLIRNVVCLAGDQGEALNAQAGYVQIGNNMMRIMDITVPMIISDAWNQVP